MKRWITLAALASMAMACGQGDGGEGGEDDGDEIRGVPARTFYEEFVYDDDDEREYVYGHGSLTDQPDGDDAFAFTLFLRGDGSARVYYVEGTYDVADGPDYLITIGDDAPLRVDTTWDVEEKTLVVGDVLRCNDVGFGVDGAYTCTAERDFYMSGIGGEAITFWGGLDLDIDDSRFADYEIVD